MRDPGIIAEYSVECKFDLPLRLDSKITGRFDGNIRARSWGKLDGLVQETLHKDIRPTQKYIVGDISPGRMSFLTISSKENNSSIGYWTLTQIDGLLRGYWTPINLESYPINIPAFPDSLDMKHIDLTNLELFTPKQYELMARNARKDQRRVLMILKKISSPE